VTPTTDEGNDVKFHPFAELFPMLEGEEWEVFKDGIKATNGNKEQPIIVRIVDGQPQGLAGRNRYRACKELGIEPTVKKVKLRDEDVEAFILRDNVNRRHLGNEARKAIVAELRSRGESERQIAEKLNTSQRTVHRDLKSTEAHASVENVTGKDGKKRKAKAKPKDEGDASETPLMCKRCTRIGVRTKGCKGCEALATRAANKKGKKAGAQKNGQLPYDWRPFHDGFGLLMRQCDALGKLYGAKESADHEKLQRLLVEFKAAFQAWHKSLTRKK
jgi:ParB-like chromosome segregation protein Spo0J